jgi:hypothetical protein
MVTGNHAFVFVVCGDRSYIDTLNTAMRCLRARTKQRIVVITDSRRNDSAIEADAIIDIETPLEFNHHQASVYLKTSIHRYLNLELGRYCYLDSDVLAITPKADDVFLEEPGIVGFCADNMTLDLFSPYAVNCGCLDQARKDEASLHLAQEAYARKLEAWNDFVIQNKGDLLMKLIADAKSRSFAHIFTLSRFALEKAWPFCSKAQFKGYTFSKEEKSWFDNQGRKVLYPIESYFDAVSSATGFKYSPHGDFWDNGRGQDVCIPRCKHLHEQIRLDTDIQIAPEAWQHWNGGVFLFDKRSVEFLEYWHQQTLRIFKEPAWKTRDQGTLAQSVWKFGLQNQPVLNRRFNYIIDHHKPGLEFDEEKGFSRDHGGHWEQPDMIHVYHRFGDPEWDLWQFIQKRYLSTAI